MQSIIILVQYRGTSFTSAYEERYYSADYSMSEENGLQFAFGLFTTSNETNLLLEDLFELKATVITLDNASQQKKVLDLHECTLEELGLEGESSKFYEMNDDFKSKIRSSRIHLVCFD